MFIFAEEHLRQGNILYIYGLWANVIFIYAADCELSCRLWLR